jgi:PAS domain S-box-containing protein
MGPELPLKALDSIGLGFVISQTKGRHVSVVYCNTAIEEMLNVRNADLISTGHPFLANAAVPVDAQQAIRAALESNATLRTTVHYVRGDGIPCWVALSLNPIKVEHGTTNCHVWIHEDIGPRVASEELWTRYEAIVNSSKEFMALIGRDYTIALANASFCRAMGLSTQDLVGSHLRVIWGADDFRTRLEPHLERCFAGDAVRFRDHLRLPHAMGQFHETMLYPYCSKGTEVTHAVFISRNITALKESEDALRKLNQELEQRVRERTAELNALLKDMESFNYSIAHDLRAPLRFVNAFSRMLAQAAGDSLPVDCQEYVHNIQEGVRQMDKLIAALLDFARSGSKALARRTVDVRTLTQEVIDDLRQDERNAHVHVEIGQLEHANADPALLKQVFTNLLSNAMKFARSRQDARIEIECVLEKGNVVYVVKDNGVGFDMRYATEIFGVFKRLVSETNVEGSGIGLAIVKRIVERHGGHVWAESEPGRGATFKFTLGAAMLSAVEGM